MIDNAVSRIPSKAGERIRGRRSDWKQSDRCAFCAGPVYQITSVETAPLWSSHAQGQGMESKFNTSVVSIASMISMSLMAGQYKKWQSSSVWIFYFHHQHQQLSHTFFASIFFV